MSGTVSGTMTGIRNSMVYRTNTYLVTWCLHSSGRKRQKQVNKTNQMITNYDKRYTGNQHGAWENPTFDR